MGQILWVVIGIALFAAAVMAGANYVDIDAIFARQVRVKTVAGFNVLVAGYTAYRTANNTVPPTADWETALSPGYMAMPTVSVVGATWEFGRDGTFGDYFCLTGSMTSAQYNGLISAANDFATTAYYVSTVGCGERISSTAPASFPSAVSATYWVNGE